MPRISPLFNVLTLGVAAAAGAGTPAFAAWPHSPVVNLPVCTAANSQTNPKIVEDGRGGAVVVWQDNRSPTTDYDIYAQHILRSGAVDPTWPAGGRVLCSALGAQTNPVVIPDGGGGALVAWTDGRVAASDIYAGHVLSTGAADPGWPINGVAVCTASGVQSGPLIVADGGAGAIVVWTDARAGNTDVYAQHVLGTGSVDPTWPGNGRGAVTQVDPQTSPTACSDGAGGVFAAWKDARGTPITFIYGTRILSSGVVDPAWPSQGLLLSGTNGGFETPAIAPDGFSGAIVTWSQPGFGRDIVAQRVYSSGTVAWQTGGISVCGQQSDQITPAIIPDGTGGAILSWFDYRNVNDAANYAGHVLGLGILDPAWPPGGLRIGGTISFLEAPVLTSDGAGGAIAAWRHESSKIHAQHVRGTGTADPAWPTEGRDLCLSYQVQSTPAIAPDGAGGGIVAWTDGRSGTLDIYAQRIAPFSYLGTPEVEIASVRDVAGDQGGKIKLSWNGSYLDSDSDPNLYVYEIYRSLAATAAVAAIAAGESVSPIEDPRPRSAGALTAIPVAGSAYYWEFVSAQTPLHYITTYSTPVSTGGDSTGSNPATTAFMVVSRSASGSMYWLSAPDSGHSIDNLPPSAPQVFTGHYDGETTFLDWNANGEADLAGYRLYRGVSPNFVPGPASLIATLTDTRYADEVGLRYYYRLTAIDVHENESEAVLLLPDGTTEVAIDDPSPVLALGPPLPNPAREAVRFEIVLPSPGPSQLSIHDASGRRVRTLWSGASFAGDHSWSWDLRDARGYRVKPGIYWVMLVAQGHKLERRLVVL